MEAGIGVGRLNPETPGPGNGNPEDAFWTEILPFWLPALCLLQYVLWFVCCAVRVWFPGDSLAGQGCWVRPPEGSCSTGAATGTAYMYLGQRKWAAASRCRDLKRWRTSCHLRSGQKCWLRVALVHGYCTGRTRTASSHGSNPSPWIPQRVGYHLTRNSPCYCTVRGKYGINGVFISGMKPWASANAGTLPRTLL